MNHSVESDRCQFDAFISYSRKDKFFAEKLEKALESFKPPKELNVPQRNLNIFRDEGDMTGTEYFQSINNHLQNSAKLIVICTPDARKSDYVNDEIQRFATARSRQHIISVLIAGVPNNIAKSGQEHQKAFPEELCKVLDMPLAISYLGFDYSKDKINKGIFEDSWYTLLSNIYNVSRGEIEQREKRRQIKRRRIISAMVASIIVSLSILAGIALWQRDLAIKNAEVALTQEKRAIAERNEALRTQSIFLAKQSRDQTDTGRTDLAIKLALEALPENLDRPDRPYVATAEMALYSAVARQIFSSIFDTGEPDLKAVAISPDGKRIVTLNSGIVPHIRIWDSLSSEPIAMHHTMKYYVSTMDISNDGRYLAVSFVLGQKTFTTAKKSESIEEYAYGRQIPVLDEVQIFDIDNGKLLDKFGVEGFSNNYVKFSPVERHLLVSTDDRVVLLEILVDGIERSEIPDAPYFKTYYSMGKIIFSSPLGAKAIHAEFDADGKTVLIVNKEGVGTIFDLTGEYGHRYIRVPNEKFFLATFSPNNKNAVVLSKTGHLYKVEILTGLVIQEFPLKDGDRYVAAKFFEKDNSLLTISREGYISKWKFDKIQLIEKEKRTNTKFIEKAYFCNQARNVMVGFDDGGVESWSLENNDKINILNGTEIKLIDADSDATSRHFLIAGSDNVARLWKIQHSLKKTLFSSPGMSATFSEFSPNGKFVAIGYKNGTLELVDAYTRRKKWKQDQAHKKAIRHISFNDSGNLLVTGSVDKDARVWNTASGKVHHNLKGHERAVWWTIFSPDDTNILTVSNDATARLWQTESGQLLYQLPVPKKFLDFIYNASILPRGAFTKNGRYVVTVTAGDGYEIEQPALVWDRENGKLLHALEHRGAIYRLRITPNDRYVVTASYDHTAAIWDIYTGKKIKTLAGHSDVVTNVQIFPGMRYLATSSNDGTIRIWDYESAMTIHILEGHTWGIYALSLSDDGRLLASGDAGGNLRLWDARTGFFIKEFQNQKGQFLLYLNFNKDKDRLLSVTENGSVHLYPLPPIGQHLINIARKPLIEKHGSFLTEEQRIRFSLKER